MVRLDQDIYKVLIWDYKRPLSSSASSVLIHDTAKNKCLLIDCGLASDHKKLIESLSAINLRVSDIEYVFLTHVHIDHAGMARLLQQQGVKICTHKNGFKIAKAGDYHNTAAFMYGVEFEPFNPDIELKPGDEIGFGKYIIKILYTPGHTTDHLSFLISKKIGDKSICIGVLGDVAGAYSCHFNSSMADARNSFSYLKKYLHQEDFFVAGHDGTNQLNKRPDIFLRHCQKNYNLSKDGIIYKDTYAPLEGNIYNLAEN
jgi:glyoxylase-like metal-dependent hydrolase (beta-lactamase superfamily II)